MELNEFDEKGDLWLEDQRQSVNLAHNFKEPPVELGKYWGSFCSRNDLAYKNYKNQGIKEMARSEIRRFDKKLKL